MPIVKNQSNLIAIFCEASILVPYKKIRSKRVLINDKFAQDTVNVDEYKLNIDIIRKQTNKNGGSCLFVTDYLKYHIIKLNIRYIQIIVG